MAAPTLGTSTAPAITSGALNSPSGTAVGDLLVFTVWSQGADQSTLTHTATDGTYVQIRTHAHNDGTDDGRLTVFVKQATSAGANSYTPCTIANATANQTSIGVTLLLAGTWDTAILTPTVTSNSATQTTNAVPDPASVTSLTGDFIVFAIGAWHVTTAAATAATTPTNYTIATQNSASSHVTHLAIATRTLTGLATATEDPGAFGDNVAPNGTASMTIAFKGSATFYATDATSSKARPATRMEINALLVAAGRSATANAPSSYLCQETSGNLADTGGGARTLTATATPSYNQSFTGWATKVINFTQSGTNKFAGSVPAANGTSFLGIFYVAITSTPSGVRQVVEHPNLYAEINTTPAYRANGGSVVTGAVTVNTSIHPVVVRSDVTATTLTVITDQEVIASTWTSVAAAAFTLGSSTSTGPPMSVNFGMMLTGADAEMTDAQVRTLLQTMGWTVSWGGGGTLTAGSGSFAMTGSTATLKVSHKVVADSGSFATTGTAATLKVSHKVAAGSGAFAMTGTATGLLRKSLLAAAAASFVMTGTSATLARRITVAASSGSFALTGTAAGLRQGHRVAGSSGAFTMTGTAAGLLRASRLVAGAGSFSETGADASLRVSHRVAAGSGAFAMSGSSAGLRTNRVIAVGSGTFAMAGTVAGLLVAHRLAADGGAFTMAGSTASLIYTQMGAYTLAADAGAFTFAGSAVGLRRTFLVGAGSGSFVMAGSAAGLRLERRLGVGPGVFAMEGSEAALLVDRLLAADSGAFALAGSDAGSNRRHLIVAQAGSLSSISVTAQASAIVSTTQASTISAPDQTSAISAASTSSSIVPAPTTAAVVATDTESEIAP